MPADASPAHKFQAGPARGLKRRKQSFRSNGARSDRTRLMANLSRLLLLASLCWPSCAVAEGDALLWTAVTANGPLGRGVLFTGDAQARIGGGATDFRQHLVRVGLGAVIGGHVTAHVGYAWFRTGTDERLSTEHRAWQQLSYPLGKNGRTTLSARTRLEQRFFDGADRASWRVRQQVRAVRPLGAPGSVSATLSVEGFFNLNAPRRASQSGLDRWRVQAGLSVPVARGLSVEPAFVHQFIRRRGEDLAEHALLAGLALRW